jgi:multimeric flavodoxin WrbA
MQIVTLLGSPRTQGNSATIARHVNATAEALGAQVRTFELNKLSYRGCQACYACKKGHETCVLKDDLTEVFAAIDAADLLVLASPVYYGEITSQLKGFIDRSYAWLRPDYLSNPQPSRLAPKKLLFVLTQGHPDATLFADIFPRYEQFLRWQGFNDVRLVRACGVGPGRDDGVPAAVFHEAAAAVQALLDTPANPGMK